MTKANRARRGQTADNSYNQSQMHGKDAWQIARMVAKN
jgi:hypothetical protein